MQRKVRESQEKCQSQYVQQRSAEPSVEVGKKPWQIYLHPRMAPTRPFEEQGSEKRQQASLEKWFYRPLAGKPSSPFRLRQNFGLRSF